LAALLIQLFVAPFITRKRVLKSFYPPNRIFCHAHKRLSNFSELNDDRDKPKRKEMNRNLTIFAGFLVSIDRLSRVSLLIISAKSGERVALQQLHARQATSPLLID
jgi:hypothetical protein